MNKSPDPISKSSLSLRGSLLLVSAAGISYQLMLMQFFSYLHWNHFANIIISVALLGFGTAGTLLTIYENWFLKNFKKWFPRLLCLSAATIAIALPLVSLDFIRFDSFLFFSGTSHWIRLLATYVILFIPFFLVALAIGSSFIKFPMEIGVLYFCDLIGAGLGGILALALMTWLLPWKQHTVIALLPLFAGVLCIPQEKSKLDLMLWLIGGGLILVQFFWTPAISGSQFKDLNKVLLLPEAEIEFTSSSPHGVLEVVSSPALRYAPGISLAYNDEIPALPAVFQSGDWIGPIMPRPGHEIPAFEFSGEALAFQLAAKRRMLVLDSGTGEYIAQGLWHQFDSIIALESNADLVKLMRGALAEASQYLWSQPAVHGLSIEARTFLMATEQAYDLVMFPRLGSFGGMGGIEALQEDYLLTKEAMTQVFDHLTQDGLASITCWWDSPPRASLRLISTIIAALEDVGIDQPESHLIVLGNWGTMTIILSKSPLSNQVLAEAQDFCYNKEFDALLLGSTLLDTADQLHQQQGGHLMHALRSLIFNDRQQFLDEYDFTLQPPTDLKPYFFQFIKMDRLSKLRQQLGSSHLFLELGYAVIWLAFLLILVVAITFIFLPLFRLGFGGPFRRYTFFYFAGIGIGYLFLEIVFIQQFTLFLGHPIYAATGVITILLIASGLGSWYSSRLETERKSVMRTAALIMGVILMYGIFLTTVLQNSVGTNLVNKLLIMLLVIGPLGFLMGMMFPLGIRWLASHQTQRMIPWAWGINGYFSVVSALLASILAVEIGFAWIFFLAGVAYGLPLVVHLKPRRKGSVV